MILGPFCWGEDSSSLPLVASLGMTRDVWSVASLGMTGGVWLVASLGMTRARSARLRAKHGTPVRAL